MKCYFAHFNGSSLVPLICYHKEDFVASPINFENLVAGYICTYEAKSNFKDLDTYTIN